MKISIDLDDTILVRDNYPFTEIGTSPLVRGAVIEHFRAGTRELFYFLEKTNFEVGIYTNSYRGKSALENWFKENGFKINFVINQQIHDVRIDKEPNRYSLPDKCPHFFGIDIHIDDLKKIKDECEKFGVTVILADEEEDWAEKVINELKSIEL